MNDNIFSSSSATKSRSEDELFTFQSLLGSQGPKQLEKILLNNINFGKLNLASFELFCECLGNNTQLKHLVLSNCNLTTSHGLALSQGLTRYQNQTLQILQLTGPPMHDSV